MSSKYTQEEIIEGLAKGRDELLKDLVTLKYGYLALMQQEIKRGVLGDEHPDLEHPSDEILKLIGKIGAVEFTVKYPEIFSK